MSQQYDQSKLKRLTACEAIRLHPEKYLPAESNRRNALLMGALCLSLAEAHCGSCTSIQIRASRNRVAISDNGLGLSLKVDADGLAFAERILTELYACRDHKAHHDLSHELCGVGIVVVNALCDEFIAEIHSGGRIHQQTYRDGIATGKFQSIGETSRTGTEFQFTIAERFAGRDEFDLEALRTTIATLKLDLSTVRIVTKP